MSGVDGLHGDAALLLKLTEPALHNGVKLAAAAQPAVQGPLSLRDKSSCTGGQHCDYCLLEDW